MKDMNSIQKHLGSEKPSNSTNELIQLVQEWIENPENKREYEKLKRKHKNDKASLYADLSELIL